MPKSQFQQTSFASGELSPLLLGRTDLDQYYKGAQTAEGVVIVPQGGVKRRPGLDHIAETLGEMVYQTDITAGTANGISGAILRQTNAVPILTASNYSVADDPWVIATYDFASYTPIYISIQNAQIQARLTTTEIKTANLTLQYSADGTSWTNYHTLVISSEENKEVTRRYDVQGLSVANRQFWRLTTDLGNQADWRIALAVFNGSGASALPANPKVFDWEYAPDHNFVCVLTPGNMRIYRAPHAGATTTEYVADIIVPYVGGYGSPTDSISSVRAAQTENVMLLFQEDNIPYRVIYDGTDSVNAFNIGYINFANPPQYDFNDSQSPIPIDEIQEVTFSGFNKGERYRVTVEGVTSLDISYGGDTGTDQQAATAENLRQGLQDMPVFGFTGISVVRTGSHKYKITISGESAKNFLLFSGFPVTEGSSSDTLAFEILQSGAARKEAVWSTNRGWPKSGVFSDGRLWLGGTKSKPQSLFASRAGAFLDFFSQKGEDDEGIFLTIDSRGLTDIVDIVPDRGLQVFCSGAEFLVKGTTPASIEVVSQTQHGSFSLEAQAVDGTTLFVDKNGNTLRQFVFNFSEDSYTSNDLSVLSSQLVNNPKDMAILKGNTTEDSNWLFIVNQDGTASVLNTMRNQDINGFTRWTPAVGNGLQSCCTVDNQLYVTNSRIFGSSAKYFLERWSFDHLLDGSIKTTVTATGSDVVVTVGSHLTGYTVGVLADGDVLANRACTGETGVITITAAELSGFTSRQLEVGLNFNVKVKTMPLNTNPGTRGGQNIMKRKKITNINLRVLNSAGIYIDGNAVPIRQFGDAQDTPLNTPFVPRTGIIEDENGGNGWSTEVVPEITVPDGTPFHLQAIQYEVESS